jgi:hypothetical protein
MKYKVASIFCFQEIQGQISKDMGEHLPLFITIEQSQLEILSLQIKKKSSTNDLSFNQQI